MPKYILLVIRTICLIIGAIIIAPAVQTKTDPRGWSLALLFGGVVMCIIAGIQIYDSRPIPAIRYRAAQPLQLVHDEPWRKTTSLRFLEKLKEEAASLEKEMAREYAVAVDAYAKLSKAAGRIEYNRLQHEKRGAEYAISHIRTTANLFGYPRRLRQSEFQNGFGRNVELLSSNQ